MINKKPVPILLTSAVAIVAVLGVCYSPMSKVCYGNEAQTIAVAALLFGIVLGGVSLFLLFLSERIYGYWWKFARIYLPIAAVLIVLSSFGSGGGGWGLPGIDTELVTWFLSGLFFVASLGIIIYKAIKSR